MSVILDFDVCESSNCDKFSFKESTRAYSGTNTSGWGSPNDTVASTTSATLTITDPNALITILNLRLVTPTFPTTDTTQEYIITPANIGATGTKFTDGIYIFLYTVVANGTTYTQTVQKLFNCNAKCCVQSLFAAIDDFECECNDAQKQEAYQADILYRALQRAAKCGNTNRFTEVLGLIQNLCSTSSTCTECN